MMPIPAPPPPVVASSSSFGGASSAASDMSGDDSYGDFVPKKKRISKAVVASTTVCNIDIQ
jgi:hypothetical protein